MDAASGTAVAAVAAACWAVMTTAARWGRAASPPFVSPLGAAAGAAAPLATEGRQAIDETADPAVLNPPDWPSLRPLVIAAVGLYIALALLAMAVDFAWSAGRMAAARRRRSRTAREAAALTAVTSGEEEEGGSDVDSDAASSSADGGRGGDGGGNEGGGGGGGKAGGRSGGGDGAVRRRGRRKGGAAAKIDGAGAGAHGMGRHHKPTVNTGEDNLEELLLGSAVAGGAPRPGGVRGKARRMLGMAALAFHTRLRRARRRVQAFESKDGKLIVTFLIIRTSLTLLVSVTYVVGTYRRRVETWYRVIFGVAGSLMSVDFLVHLLTSEVPWHYMLRWPNLLHCAALPSLLMVAEDGQWLNFGFLIAATGYDSSRRLLQLFMLDYGSQRLLLNVLFQTLLFLFLVAGSVQLIEIASSADPAGEGPGVFVFFSAFYFTVVTASTVGYGDISPKSFYGRAFVLLAIFGGVIFFSKLVGELVANSSKLRGSGALHKRPGAAHVILGGDPNLDDVALFAKEFFSLASNRRRKICVMVSEPSWSEDDWHRLVRTCTLYRNYLTFLAGSAMSREDLNRAHLKSADAYFLLQSSASSNPQAQDTSLLMRALSIRNVRADVPVYAVCLLEDSRVQMWHAIQHGSESARAIRSVHATRSPLLNDLYRMSESRLHSPIDSLIDWTRHHTQAADSGPLDPRATRSVDSLLSPAAASKVGHLLQAPSADSAGSAGGAGTSNITRTGSADESAAASSIMALAVSLKTGEPLDALTRSQVICLQSVRMTLLAENVHCNGLSTLLSNCILDIRPSRHARSGASAWLREYTDGAACSLCHCIIPHYFHGQTLAQVATPLYDQGVILLGVKRPHDRCFSLTVNVQGSVLSAGTVALVLTYNDAEDLQAVMFDVAERYEAARTTAAADGGPPPPPPHVAVDVDKSAEPPGQQPALNHVAVPLDGAGDARVTMNRKYTTDRQEGPSQGGVADPTTGGKQRTGADGAGGAAVPARGHVRRFSAPIQGPRLLSPSPSSDASVRPSKAPGSTVTDGSSSSTPAAGGARDSQAPDDQTNTVAGIKGLPLRKYLSELRPVVATSLRRHVIICFDGAVQLLNLRLLLAMLCRRSSPYLPLLVMHPDGAGEAAARIRTELGLHGVELLSGSSTSPASWHRAAFSRARAVINMTDLSSKSLANDDKTLFTDVTMETMTEESSDIYVQSELMKEDALEFLREPVHARRRGAHLGGTVASALTEQLQGMLSSEPARDRERDAASSRASGDASSGHSGLVSDRQRPRTPHASTDGSASAGQTRSAKLPSSAGSSEDDHPGGGSGGGGSCGGGDRRRSPAKQAAASPGSSHPDLTNRQNPRSRRVPGIGGTGLSNDQGGDDNVSVDDLESLDEEETSKISNLSSYDSQEQSTEQVLERDRRSRGLLFERARYASGELVVHSVMQTLLVRDFTASGFAAAIMTLMGVPGYTSRPLIRQLPVCRHWYTAFQHRAGLTADDAPTIWDAPAPSGPIPAKGRPPTFRDVFTTLLSVRVVAIGLYRSGEAPVLMPVERREERGRRVSGRAGGHSGSGFAASANANLAEEKLPCELDYTVGTTGEQWRYAALGAARNKLPYVSTLPEPYAIVSQEDAVFVLAPEELKIPARWPLLPAAPPMP